MTMMDNPMLDKKLEQFRLSKRARKLIERAGLVTVRDLVNTSEAELIDAALGITEIKEVLAVMGMHLRRDDE